MVALATSPISRKMLTNLGMETLKEFRISEIIINEEKYFENMPDDLVTSHYMKL